MRIAAIAAMLSWFAAAGLAAHAEDCKPLQYVTGVPMTVNERGDVLVPVTIDGASKAMTVITGGLTPFLNADVTTELKLPLNSTPLNAFSSNGAHADSYATVASFQLGRINIPHLQFMVWQGGPPSSDFVGTFPLTLLQKFDIDIDFGARRINFFLPDHCEGQGVYWLADTVAVVPAEFRDGVITIPVVLDGKKLDALIVVGGSTEMSFLQAGLSFGLTPESPKVSVAYPSGDPSGTKTYHYVFSSLSFEGVTIANPRLILGDTSFAESHGYVPTGSQVKRYSRPAFQIGSDILRKLHLYIARKEQKIYIAPADGKAAATLPPLDSHP